jgi:glycosyltransferase involved in cell wall biosynthesis
MGHWFGGVTNVAYNLPRALAKYARVTYYPTYYPPVVPRRSYTVSLLNVYKRLLMKDYEIVHFCHNPGWTNGRYVLFKLADIKHISTIFNIHGIIQVEHVLFDKSSRGLFGVSYEGLSSTLKHCKFADKIVTYSEFMRNEIEIWYGVNREKIAVIPNGVNITMFSECNQERFLDGDPAILYIGNLGRFKNPEIIIHAISRIGSELPKLRLHLVGPGEHSARDLKNIAKKKGVERQVVFHGSIPWENVPFYYKSSDLCVFPSKRDNGTITLLEAMASGAPIIASNRGGTPEIISHNKNGVLFDPDNPAELSNAILTMQKNPEFKKTITYNAMETVKKYSWENIAKRYLALYRSLRD